MRLRRNALAAIGGIAMVYILGAVAIGVGAPAGNPVPGPSKSDPNTPPAKSAQPAAVITLIAPGKPPLRELRYNPKPGSEQLISMRMLQSVTQSAGPNQQRTMNVPEVTIKSKIKIVDVTADGDIHAEQTVTAILIKSDPNDPQNKTTTEMLDRAFEPIRNQTITLSLDKRGGVKEISEFKIGGSGKFSSEEMARNGTVAFPAEPVGVGAKWKAVATLTQGGITMTMTTTTEVISMEGDKLTVKTEVEGSADPQQMQLPQLPPDAKSQMDMKVKGGGESTFNMGKISAISGHQLAETVVNTKITSPSRNMDVTQTMKMEVNISEDTGEAAAPVKDAAGQK